MEEIAWVLREYGPDRQEFRATIPCNTKSSICPFRKLSLCPFRNFKKGFFPHLKQILMYSFYGVSLEKIRAFDGRITCKPSDWHRCEPVG